MIPLGGKNAEIAPKLFFLTLTRVFGVRVEVRGEQSSRSPTLYVANHVSWLDIFLFGGVMRGSFVARGDMEGWPIFGWLSTLQQTVFIDRTKRARSGQQLDQLSERLQDDHNLILFPEGTTSTGGGVQSFKSSLFAVVERWSGEKELVTQPVSIAYTAVNNMPLTRHYRPYIGWYGDMELHHHFWDFLKLGNVTAIIEFHDPVAASTTSRKVMSEQCQQVIAASIEKHNTRYDHDKVA